MSGSSFYFGLVHSVGYYAVSVGACFTALSVLLFLSVQLRMLSDNCFAMLETSSLIMAPAVLILSLGNNVHRHNPLEILAGIIGILVLIFFPALYHKLDNKVFTTATIEDAAYFSTLARTFNIIIGSILLFFQFCNIIRWMIPDSKLVQSKFLSLVLRGSGVRSEFGIKQATLKKVDRLVTNAHELHIEEREGYFNNQSRSGPSEVSGSKCLLNYMKLSENRETCGGFIWAWKAFLTDGLVEGEGASLLVYAWYMKERISQSTLTFHNMCSVNRFQVFGCTPDFLLGTPPSL